MAGSFSNVGSTNTNTSVNNQKQPENKSTFNLKGNPISNLNKDLKEIGTGVTTLIGGVLGYDKEARQAIGQTINKLYTNPGEGLKDLGNAVLATYNISIDDFGKMPLGEMVGNIASGAWEHPFTTFTDVMTLGELSGANKVLRNKVFKKADKVNDMSVRVKLAEEVARDNTRLHAAGLRFQNEIDSISKKYDPKTISRGMQAVETVGFKNAPKELVPVMRDLTRANDSYKQFTQMAGAQMIDDVEMATRELIAREHGITFEDAATLSKDTNLYKDVEKYVIENEVKPLFHLQPKIKRDMNIPESELIKSDLLQRKFGGMDYEEAGQNLSKKSADFINKVVKTKTLDSAKTLNNKIDTYNAVNKTNIKKLDEGSRQLFNNKFINELNNELKKVMLSSGVYLGANVLTTTLSILNNFNLDAAARTFKNLPKYRFVELAEAKSPVLNIISRVNNKVYKPIASFDKWLEDLATTYIDNLPEDQYKFMQSTTPSKGVPTSNLESAANFVSPFASYPIAAIKEVLAHIKYKPGKALFYNQVQKEGQQLNEQAEELANIPQNLREETIEAVRPDPNNPGQYITRNTVITPVQAAQMFLTGFEGDAIQIPILKLVQDLVEGKGDPTQIKIEGKTYKMDKGVIKTAKGDFNMLPSILYVARKTLSPIQVYNQVLVPLISDKYYVNSENAFNQIVEDSKYASLSSNAKRRIVTNARERLGKRVLGTYEYPKYNYKISKRIVKKYNQNKNLSDEIKRKLK